MSRYRDSFFITILSLLSSGVPSLAQDFGPPGLPDKKLQAEAIYIDAVKAGMLGEDKQQEELLLQVIHDYPDEAAPYYDLARLYMTPKHSKPVLAEQHIKKAIELDKDNAWYQRQYAEVLVSQNKFDSAAEVYTQLARKEKYNQEFLLKGAMLYQKSGKYQEAIALLDELLQKTGQDEEILITKQQIYLRMNDLQSAVKVAQQLIDQNPRDGQYYRNLAELYQSNNEPEKALEVYLKALKTFPNDASLQYGIAEYYKKKGDTDKYDEFIGKAILNRDFDDETQTAILGSYLDEVSNDTLRRKRGVTIMEQLAGQHPDNARVISLYGQVLARNNEPEKAAQQFKKALAIDPSRFNIWQELLFLYAGPADADSLIRYSERAMRYFPNQALIHYYKGVGHQYKKEFTEAVRSINRAIELQPEEGAALLAGMYSSLGDVYHAMKEFTLSDSSYAKALRLDPDNASVLNNYSYYLSVRGIRLSDAEKMSKRSLEIRPGEATFLDTYGWILYRQGKYQEARKYIEDALKGAPDADGTLLEHLGDVYYRLGITEKALEYWKKAKEKGTENQQIDRKIQDKKLYE